ncbi:hypothetical protein PRtIB026_A38480 [Pseudomonas sp. RtIB026]|nr:hypothetical protein PRtIB026_A38480 [Pseudomonas sp. RtIB026]
MDDLRLMLAEKFSERGDERLAQKADTATLKSLLKEPVLLILDEFQNTLADDGRPCGELMQFFTQVTSMPCAGRILLLSSRSVELQRWNERFERRTVQGLPPEEAVQLFDGFLHEENVNEVICAERKYELMLWLGGYPRAIKLLANRLRYEPLDGLVGLAKQDWEACERVVSPTFIRAFEELMLSRARQGLALNVEHFLKRLSVFRQPATLHAMRGLLDHGDDLMTLAESLVAHFMIELRRDRYIMHPVLRDTTLAGLEDTFRRQAHRMAGEYFGRHFTGKQIVGQVEKLGGAFVEARYHYLQGGHGEPLKEITLKFEGHIRTTMGWMTPVPANPREMDERISVLLALLSDQEGGKGLHFYLAKLLSRRRQGSDLELALRHARLGAGPHASSEAWSLRVQLEGELHGSKNIGLIVDELFADQAEFAGLAQVCLVIANVLDRFEGPERAVAFMRKGIGRSKPNQNLFSLYQSAGEMLDRIGQWPEAVALLREGIGRIEPKFSLSSLYQLAGEILARAGKRPEANAILEEGLARIQDGKYNRYKILTQLLYQAYAAGDGEQLKIYLALYCQSQAEQTNLVLGTALAHELDRNWAEVVKVVAAAIEQGVFTVSLVARLVFAHLSAGAPALALQVLQRFAGRIEAKENNVISWLQSLVALQNGDLPSARSSLAIHLGEEVKATDVVALREQLLLTWQMQSSRNQVRYYFPHLPSCLLGQTSPSGLDQALDCVQPGGTAPAAGHLKSILAIASEWFSRHGGLSTFNRELCVAMAQAGHRVACLVPGSDEEERRHAADHGVSLVHARHEPHMKDIERLGLRTEMPDGFAPNIVIGHDHITGGAARIQCADFFPAARRVHFIHTAPGDIEWYKAQQDGVSASARAEQKERLQIEMARTAQLVVAVGPLLTEEINMSLYPYDDAPPVHQMIPGMINNLPTKAGHPPQPRCLVLGRTEDAELKGLDIAARALALVKDPPMLIVRGAGEGQGDALCDRLKDWAVRSDLRVRTREYTATIGRLTEDLRQASLLLMPSRSEGFGLVGLEAIAAGIPVLVSKRSGLARVLLERLPNDLANLCVVEVLDQPDQDAQAWRESINNVMCHRASAFVRAREIAELLAQELTWGKSVAAFMQVLDEQG